MSKYWNVIGFCYSNRHKKLGVLAYYIPEVRPLTSWERRSICNMKKDIHPENYRMVIFHDNSSNERMLIGSTIETEETDTWTDGKEYPIFKVDVTSASHPFYTGQEKVMDSAGRVDRFKQRMAKAGDRKKK